MLRVRRVGSRYFQTIKASGNLAPFERDEWETEIGGQEPDLSLATRAMGSSPLAPVRRSAWHDSIARRLTMSYAA